MRERPCGHRHGSVRPPTGCISPRDKAGLCPPWAHRPGASRPLPRRGMLCCTPVPQATEWPVPPPGLGSRLREAMPQTPGLRDTASVSGGRGAALLLSYKHAEASAYSAYGGAHVRDPEAIVGGCLTAGGAMTTQLTSRVQCHLGGRHPRVSLLGELQQVPCAFPGVSGIRQTGRVWGKSVSHV